ncbi:MAG: DASS family sodium-coupled anion symporter [Nanoarchaeota archaeon]|nr:DASS family sodium-coupled anion symporter [Nanoarchaeota archaeon]
MEKEVHGIRLQRGIIAALLAILVYALPFPLGRQQHVMVVITVFVAALWIAEVLPVHVTALGIAFLLVVVMKLPPKEVFTQYFDPTIVLLLGGFVLAVAMTKHNLDHYLAQKVVEHAGRKPEMMILALLITTTFISMWISNSAAAAIVMPIAVVLLVKNHLVPGHSNIGKASVLAVGYGATIGGMGTIIGSTPNVLAAKFLTDAGYTFGFFEWFIRGFPFMLLLMFAGWYILIRLYKPEKSQVLIVKEHQFMTAQHREIIFIFLVTVLLWVTEPIHGVQSSMVAIIAIILLYAFGLLGTDDFSKVDWPTLILIGGGMALGYGIHQTKLDAVIAAGIASAMHAQSALLLFLILGVFGVLFTVFISNTTAAAIYLPIVASLASTVNIKPISAVMAAGVGVSLDFVFPFGTPPTAIAYGTKYVSMKDIIKAGILISITGVIILGLLSLVW